MLACLAEAGALDSGLKVRTIALPDRFLDHDKPDRMYAAAGLDAAGIVAKALSALGAIEPKASGLIVTAEGAPDPPPGPARANLAALIAVLVIAALGYWAFTAIERQREIARCLDEGRRDCLELVAPDAAGANGGANAK